MKYAPNSAMWHQEAPQITQGDVARSVSPLMFEFWGRNSHPEPVAASSALALQAQVYVPVTI
jgi:hypothetical protein